MNTTQIVNAAVFQRATEVRVSYGTAGYRGDSEMIYDIISRAYITCAIRSAVTGCPVGLMLTASHNKASDNGIKYIDTNGNMVDNEMEKLSDLIVNYSLEDLKEALHTYFSKEDGSSASRCSVVYIARDTRKSGDKLLSKCLDACKMLGSAHALVDVGIITTPQLHFLLREMHARDVKNVSTPGYALVEEILPKYYQRIKSFILVAKRVFGGDQIIKRVLDSSNGVARKIIGEIRDSMGQMMDIPLLSNNEDLNANCGSDHIKSKKQLPSGVSNSNGTVTITTDKGEINESVFICAFDGDADRILYLKPCTIGLLDGDRLCVLFSSFINHLLSVAGEKAALTSVVTEYSNGAAMKELRGMSEMKVASTGVKNMQREACKHPLSVWFESNGHGTVYFSPALRKTLAQRVNWTSKENFLDLPESEIRKEVDRILAQAPKDLATPEERRSSPYNTAFRSVSVQEAQLLLFCMSKVFDPFIGDAIVNMCVIESIFYSRFILPDVLLNVYKDLPNVLASVNGNRKILTDLFVQSVKDRYSDVRVHLRASGTEDVIRIYSEGENILLVEKTVAEISEMLLDM